MIDRSDEAVTDPSYFSPQDFYALADETGKVHIRWIDVRTALLRTYPAAALLTHYHARGSPCLRVGMSSGGCSTPKCRTSRSRAREVGSRK